LSEPLDGVLDRLRRSQSLSAAFLQQSVDVLASKLP
jgi:hypothetical protein